MKLYRFVLLLFLILISATLSFGQKGDKNNAATVNPAKFTSAYAELLLRKVELESDLESLLESYTEEFPKVKSARYELGLVNKDLTKILAQTDVSRLTLALGKLLVRKIQIETELWTLQNQYSKDHPEVKRAQRKALNFQNAIKEILP